MLTQVNSDQDNTEEMNLSSEVIEDYFSDIENTTDICDDECKNEIWGFWIEGVAVPGIALFGIFGEFLRFGVY